MKKLQILLLSILFLFVNSVFTSNGIGPSIESISVSDATNGSVDATIDITPAVIKLGIQGGILASYFVGKTKNKFSKKNL